jgi:hypothetical protein
VMSFASCFFICQHGEVLRLKCNVMSIVKIVSDFIDLMRYVCLTFREDVAIKCWPAIAAKQDSFHVFVIEQ